MITSVRCFPITIAVIADAHAARPSGEMEALLLKLNPELK